MNSEWAYSASWLMVKEDRALFIKSSRNSQKPVRIIGQESSVWSVAQRVTTSADHHLSQLTPISVIARGSGTQRKTSGLIFNLQPHYSFLRLSAMLITQMSCSPLPVSYVYTETNKKVVLNTFNFGHAHSRGKVFCLLIHSSKHRKFQGN